MNCSSTAVIEGSTTTIDTIIGFIALLVSYAGFGFFVQWVQCNVVFVVGCVINCIRGFPEFQWIVAIGGFLYATGNVFSVPIVGGLGMGVGVLIWGTMQTLVGWSVASFGLMGWLEPTKVTYPWVNYIGLTLTIIRFIAMAVGLAVLHGLMMAPIDIMKKSSASTDPYKVFDFCFAFYSSAFLFSSLYFIAHCVICRQTALVDRSLVIPSVFNGLLWTIGMSCWMLAGDKLSQVVAFPVATRLPAIIAALCDVFYKVIEGRRNLCVLAVSVLLGIFGVVAIALSNQSFS